MFFDLEDYSTTNRYIQDQIGIWNPTATQIFDSNGAWIGDPEDDATTCRATRDALLKAVNEFYLAFTNKVPVGIFELMEAKMNEFENVAIEFAPHYAAFWHAYGSFMFYGTGLVEGDATPEDYPFTIMTQAIYDNYYNSLTALMTKIKEMFELAGDYTI